MEKLLQNYNLNQYEVFSYFSCEILCLIGVLINIILYLFINKKYNIKRYSDLITFGIFSINSLISIGVFLKNKLTFGDFNFEIFNKNFFLNNEIFLFKSLFFIFLACFILCTYKLTRNTFFKGALINSSLLLLGITSSFLLQAQNELLAFIFLDLSALFIYKFASSAQIRKYETYSFGFVLMNTTSSILFYSFYLLTFLLKENMQLSIVQICLVCALLLKIGLFPIYNYIPNKYTKNNLAYSMLLFGFLPYLGIITFIKLQQNINSLNEIFLIVITSVCLVSMLSMQ